MMIFRWALLPRFLVGLFVATAFAALVSGIVVVVKLSPDKTHAPSSASGLSGGGAAPSPSPPSPPPSPPPPILPPPTANLSAGPTAYASVPDYTAGKVNFVAVSGGNWTSNQSPLPLRLTFSADMEAASLDVSRVSCTNAVVSRASSTPTSGASSYFDLLVAPISTDAAAEPLSVSCAVASASARHGSGVSAAAGTANVSVAWAGTPPSVNISSSAGASTASTRFSLTAAFSRRVMAVTATGLFSLEGARALTGVALNTQDVTFNVTAQTLTAVTLTIKNGSTTDVYGNGVVGATYTVTNSLAGVPECGGRARAPLNISCAIYKQACPFSSVQQNTE